MSERTEHCRIERTPMLGIERRWTVFYLHPMHGEAWETRCMTRWGARIAARIVERAYRARERHG